MEEKDLNQEMETEETVQDDKIAAEEVVSGEIEELKSSLQRLQADFNNYRRRVETEKQTLSTFANEKIMTELLPVLDNFERALGANEDKEDEFYKGTELIFKQLFDAMKKFGLEEVASDSEAFDPNLHHAVFQEEREDMEPETVIETFQKGYKLSNKVIRPAMVKVSK